MALVDSVMHVGSSALHLLDDTFIDILLLHHSRVQALLDALLELLLAGLKALLLLEAEATSLLGENLLELLKILALINPLHDSSLHLVNLLEHMYEKLIDCALKVCADALGLHGLHPAYRLLVQIELLIEDILETRGHLRGKSEHLLGLIHIVELIVNALVAVELPSLFVDRDHRLLVSRIDLVLL